MPDPADREREIFLAALDCTSSVEQESFLERACEQDIGLRARIEALLLAHEHAGDFMTTPAFGK